jgi:hypothetical protein
MVKNTLFERKLKIEDCNYINRNYNIVNNKYISAILTSISVINIYMEYVKYGLHWISCNTDHMTTWIVMRDKHIL